MRAPSSPSSSSHSSPPFHKPPTSKLSTPHRLQPPRPLLVLRSGKIPTPPAATAPSSAPPTSGKSWSRLHIDNTDTARLPRRPILRLRHRLRLLRRQRQQIPHLQNLRRRQNLAHPIFRPAPRLLPRRPRLPHRKNLLRHQRSHRQQIPHPPHRRRRTLDRTPAKTPNPPPCPPKASSPPATPPSSSAARIKSDILFATGGPAARVFHSADNARTWIGGHHPNPQRQRSSGIFSIACYERTLVAVGGDYRNPTATKSVAAYSNDMGVTWHLADQPPAGFRSAVTSLGPTNPEVWVAVGVTGADISTDSGVHWSSFNHENANAALTIAPGLVLTVGPKAAMAQLHFAKPHHP